MRQAGRQAKALQSCLTLCDTMNGCSLPNSSVHGILQARILEWVAMPPCRGSWMNSVLILHPTTCMILHWQTPPPGRVLPNTLFYVTSSFLPEGLGKYNSISCNAFPPFVLHNIYLSFRTQLKVHILISVILSPPIESICLISTCLSAT